MKSRIISYSLMALILAAHFSRADQPILAVIVLLIPFLLFIKHSWVIYVLQTVGYLAAVIWIFVTYHFVQLRLAAGQDWVRLVIILGLVALYSAYSAYRLSAPDIRASYHFEDDQHS